MDFTRFLCGRLLKGTVSVRKSVCTADVLFQYSHSGFRKFLSWSPAQGGGMLNFFET